MEKNVIARAMPYNADAENALLGSLLIDGVVADELIPDIREEDFYLKANRLVFVAMRSLMEEGTAIDTVSLTDRLEIDGKLEEAGGIEHISNLAECVPSAASADHYADIVKRDALIRRVITAGNNIVRAGYDSVTGTDALMSAEKEVYSISEDIIDKKLVHAEEAFGKAMNAIEDAQAGNVPKNFIYTDFPSFDDMTHGLKPGELVLLAARPGVGKTAFALNIAANACLNHNKVVAIFSLEMPGELLAKRMLAYVSGVSLTAMDSRGGMSDAETGKVFAAYRRLAEANLFIDYYSMNSPTDVLSKCRRLKREKGLDLIIIDYLQLMTAGESGRNTRAAESRQLEVSQMTRQMKIFAKELGVPVLLLSQMSRGVEQRKDTPLLSDLRESGAIEQDSDIVMFLHDEHKFNPAVPPNYIRLIIRKNRSGRMGEVELDWNGPTTTFREYQGVSPHAAEGAGKSDAEYVYKAKPAEAKPDATEGDAVFAEGTPETDNGLMPFAESAEATGEEMPFAEAAEEGRDDVPFDLDDGELPDLGEPEAPDEEDEDADDEEAEEAYEESFGDEEYIDDDDSDEDKGDLPF